MALQVAGELAMTLRFAYDLAVPHWDPASTGTEVWLDNRGRECAYGQMLDGQPWMHIVGIGDFRFERGAGATVVPADGTARVDVVDTYYRTVLPFALQFEGFEVLHASAVVTPIGVLSMCAVSETGKSTLAFGLDRRGHRLFADDALVFDANSGRPRLMRVPFALRLRQESAMHFDAAPREEVRIVSGQRGEMVDLPLAANCILERKNDDEPGAAVVIERLSPQEAFSATLPHAYCFGFHDKARKARMLRSYLSLVGSTPTIRVRFKPGLANLPRILGELESRLFDLPG